MASIATLRLIPKCSATHKAAIGISESTDADVIVVSEETGNVTYFKGGEGNLISNFNELLLILSKSVEEEKDK